MTARMRERHLYSTNSAAARRRQLRNDVCVEAKLAVERLRGERMAPHLRFYVPRLVTHLPHFVGGWVCHPLPSERDGEPEPVIYLLANGRFLRPNPFGFPFPHHTVYRVDDMDAQELERALETLRRLGVPSIIRAT